MSTIYSLLYTKPHNKHYLDRYVKFIDLCVRQTHPDTSESHHIYPKAKTMFPELDKQKWNRVNLTPRQHFIAHHLLWKAYNNHAMQYAFYKMSFSEEHKGYVHSRKYEELRGNIAEQSVKYGMLNLKKMHERNTGTKWYNNGVSEARLHEPQKGWELGKLKRSAESYSKQGRQGLKYFNNGKENRKFTEAPDDSWEPGMKPRIKN